MPPNSIIVGMDALPSNMDLINDQTKLDLSSGLFKINYIFGSTQPPITQPPITQPPITQPPIITPEYNCTSWCSCCSSYCWSSYCN
jgi:hypothetical protein